MTQGTPGDGRQDPHASFWELHFNDPDVGAFLGEAVSEFVDEIGGPGRGISWAITLLRSAEALTLTAGSAPRVPRMRRSDPSTTGRPARRFAAVNLCSWATPPWSAAGPGTLAPPQLSESSPWYPFHWSHNRYSMPR